MKTTLQLSLCILLALTTSSLAIPLDGYKLTPSGLGPLKLGMSKQQVEKALQEKIDLRIDAPDSATCDFADLDEGVRLVFNHKKLDVIALSNGEQTAVTTPEGATIGMSEEALLKLYPKAERVIIHTDDARYFKVSAKKGGYLFIIEEDKLTDIKATRFKDNFAFLSTCE